MSSDIAIAARRAAAEKYGKLPLGFEANSGQLDAEVKFVSRGNGYSVFLTPTEAVISLAGKKSSAPQGDARDSKQQTVVRMKLAGANPSPKVTGLDQLPGRSNYFVGNQPPKWHTNVTTYARVNYEKIYPGIDLVYYGNQRQMEYDFVVAPGADPSRIRLNLTGADKPRVDAAGDLTMGDSENALRLKAPYIYQEIAGKRKQIAGNFILRDGKELGFRIGVYDASEPLVIDPVLVYSTYLGGSGFDAAASVAVDASGNAYVAGYTTSLNFPRQGAYQAVNGAAVPNYAAFVTKLNAAGTALVYSTYLGGTGNSDSANGIAVDSAGNAYVTGFAGSTNFPTTTGALQRTPAGNGDAYVTKLNNTGSALIYSTLLGGSGLDSGGKIAVDSSGNAYVCGTTATTASFATAGAFQTTYGGGVSDAYVAKLNPAGSGLVYLTYLGGSAADSGTAIAVDGSGNAYAMGNTVSTNFPVTGGAYQTTAHGGGDIFVAKLDPTGSSRVYSTYLGGASADSGYGMAVDSSGSAYITGSTISPDFPVSSAAQSNYGGPPANVATSGDAFVTRLQANGGGILYSTYLGGVGDDVGYSIAVDGSGNAYVTGSTGSPDFPSVNPLSTGAQPVFNEAFVTAVAPTGKTFSYSTFLGGNGAYDTGFGIAVDSPGNVYVVGNTRSTNFPTTPNAFQTTSANTLGVAFVTKISAISLPSPTITAITPDRGAPGSSVTITITGTNFTSPASVTATNGAIVSNVSVDSSTQITARLTLAATPAQGISQIQVSTSAGASNGIVFSIGTAGTFPNIASISPSSGAPGTNVNVTITGTNFDGYVALGNFGNPGVTVVSQNPVSSTQVNVVLAVASGASGTATINVLSILHGRSNSVPFTIGTAPLAPTLTSISPNQGVAGTSVNVTLTGTNFNASAIVASTNAASVSVSNAKVVSASSITATLTISGTAATGAVNIAVGTTAGSASLPFTVTAASPALPTITSITPAVGAPGTSFSVTLTGTNFGNSLIIGSSNPGVVASAGQVPTATSFTFTLTIAAGATGTSSITAITPNGTSNAVLFTVSGAAPPVITSITPNYGAPGTTVFITMTGMNFPSSLTISSSNPQVTASNGSVPTATSFTFALTIAAGATGTSSIAAVAPTGVSNFVLFTISATPPMSTYFFPQIVARDIWRTTFTYVNAGSQPVTCTTSFFGEDGLPVSLAFNNASAVTVTDTIAAGGTARRQTDAAPASPILIGWASASCTGPVKASALYRYYNAAGAAVSEVSVLAASAPATKFVTYADQTTGVAWANPGTSFATLTFTVNDTGGTPVPGASRTVSVPPGVHSSANLGPFFGLTTTFQGSLTLASSQPIISLALNADASPIFSALPPGQDDGATGPSLYFFPQLVARDVWRTTFTYVNASIQPVSCTSAFFAEDGSPLSLTFNGTSVATTSDTIPAGGTARRQTDAAPGSAVQIGWAAASCTGPVKASALYRYYNFAGGAAVPVSEVSVLASTLPAALFVTYADQTTGVAWANPSTSAAALTFTVSDATGTRVPGATRTITVASGSHGSANLGAFFGIASAFQGSLTLTSSQPIISLALNADAVTIFSSLPPGDQ